MCSLGELDDDVSRPMFFPSTQPVLGGCGWLVLATEETRWLVVAAEEVSSLVIAPEEKAVASPERACLGVAADKALAAEDARCLLVAAKEQGVAAQ